MLCCRRQYTLRIRRHSWPSFIAVHSFARLNQHNNYCKSIFGWHCKSKGPRRQTDRQTDRRGHCQSCLYFSFMLLIILPKRDKNKIKTRIKTNAKPLYNCPLAFLKHTFASSPGMINDRGHLRHSSTYFNMHNVYRMPSLLWKLLR